MTTISRQKSILLKQFNETRARTLSLVQTLEKDDFVVQTAPFMSPPKWHLGHVSWLLEVVMSKTGKKCIICGCQDHRLIGCIKHKTRKCSCYNS